MSLIIKGVKMPKEGNYEARLNVTRDGTALLFLYGECGGHAAKELPPHGRLIDADAIDYYPLPWEALQLVPVLCDLVADNNMIDDMPTIIEAEEEE